MQTLEFGHAGPDGVWHTAVAAPQYVVTRMAVLSLGKGHDDEVRLARRLGPALEVWFASHGRDFPWRHWHDVYRVTVSEVLLQRTRAEAVAHFIEPFLNQYPDWNALSATTEVALRAALQPLGLSGRRSASLRSLANYVMTTGRAPSPDAPGVGQYIDRAIRVTLGAERVAMVDTNFVRLLHRVFGGDWRADYRYDPRLQALAQGVIDGARDPRPANWAVLDLGATVCVPRRPRCNECPLAPGCRYRAQTQSSDWVVRGP